MLLIFLDELQYTIVGDAVKSLSYTLHLSFNSFDLRRLPVSDILERVLIE
jgi:hypothetical protein